MQAARHGREALDEGLTIPRPAAAGSAYGAARGAADKRKGWKDGMTSIAVIRGGEVLESAQGESEASLLYRGAYLPGDEIRFETGYRHALVQVDQAVAPARVYLPEGGFSYRPPLSGDGLAVYAPGAFLGDVHLISIRPDEGREARNMAENPADQRGEVLAYPHATANVETRDESVFAARNTIDGLHIAGGHGEWPYGSWGIGARTDAELTLDFGREILAETMTLYLRADFPHDAYWVSGRVTLADEAGQTREIAFPLEGRDGPQSVALGGCRVRRLVLDRLVKCDMPSAFPALRQIEVYGAERE